MLCLQGIFGLGMSIVCQGNHVYVGRGVNIHLRGAHHATHKKPKTRNNVVTSMKALPTPDLKFDDIQIY